MSKLAVYNSKGKEVGTVSLDKDFLKERVNTRVLYYVINNYRASQHRGTHKVKNRKEVRGGGKKPWRQKGIGRARAGTIRSPIWQGGGVTFGPKARSYRVRLPKKVRRSALLSVLRAKAREGKIMVLEDLEMDGYKTKAIVSLLDRMGVGDGEKCLLVLDEYSEFILKSARNIPGIGVEVVERLNALTICRHDRLVILQSALSRLAEEKRT